MHGQSEIASDPKSRHPSTLQARRRSVGVITCSTPQGFDPLVASIENKGSVVRMPAMMAFKIRDRAIRRPRAVCSFAPDKDNLGIQRGDCT